MFNIRGEPEDACMKLVYVVMSSFAEAVKDLPQPMSYWHETLKTLAWHT